MNAVSLNRLWLFLQSLKLSASNRAWLAEHLYEAVEEEVTEPTNPDSEYLLTNLLTEEELPESVRRLIGVAAPVESDDINGRKAYYSYLAQKYS